MAKRKQGKNRRRARRIRRVRAFLRRVILILVLCAAALVAVLAWKIAQNVVSEANHPAYEESAGALKSAILDRYRESAVVAAGADNSAWIEEGRVTVIGRNDCGQCATEDWTKVVAVALGDRHTVGLTANGRLLFAGDNAHGQCDLKTNGERAVSIAASARASYAVLESGRVVMSGSGPVEAAKLENVRGAAVVAASDSHLAILMDDGSLEAFGADARSERSISEWTNLASVSCGNGVTAALDFEGNVHVAGDSAYGQAALDGTARAACVGAGGNFCLVSLQDGTAIGAGSDSRGQIRVDHWKDVRAIACGYMHAIAVDGEGNRVYSGSDQSGQQEQ